MKEMLELYDEETSFKEQLVRDFEDGSVWFNVDEFGKFHNIDGKNVLSVFVGDQRGRAIEIRAGSNENPEGIVKSRGILFVRADKIEDVSTHQSFRLDGRLTPSPRPEYYRTVCGDLC